MNLMFSNSALASDGCSQRQVYLAWQGVAAFTALYGPGTTDFYTSASTDWSASVCPGLFTNRATLKSAADAYSTDASSAEATHGPLAGWDVSRVDEMWGLFRNMRGFNGDISNWDTGRVTTFKDMVSAAHPAAAAPAPRPPRIPPLTASRRPPLCVSVPRCARLQRRRLELGCREGHELRSMFNEVPSTSPRLRLGRLRGDGHGLHVLEHGAREQQRVQPAAGAPRVAGRRRLHNRVRLDGRRRGRLADKTTLQSALAYDTDVTT